MTNEPRPTISPPRGPALRERIADLTAALAARFGNRLVTSEAVRLQHGHTLTWLENAPPDAVVFAESREDVIDAVRICAAHDAPIVPFGAGTSLEGHVNALHGGVSLDCTRMNQVLAVHAEDLDCVVEPGVTRKALNDYLRDSGLFFPIDPGADATIGGMAATRASGTNAVRYGTMKDNVISLGVVTADGAFLRTASRAKKSSAGYDLTRLFVGSEGTLGVIVEVTLRLAGVPEAIAGGHCSFPSVRAACDATIRDHPVRPADRAHRTARRAAGEGVQRLFEARPARDADVVRRVPRHRGERRRTGAALRRNRRRPRRRPVRLGDQAGGAQPAVAGAPRRVLGGFAACGPAPARSPPTSACRSRASPTASRRRSATSPNTASSRRSSAMSATAISTSARSIDMNDPGEIARAESFSARLARRAIAMDGTCTGEHGVGQKKIGYVEIEHSPETLDLMRRVKMAFDPTNLFNPGKIFRE